jgi:RNA recognition motif-containing protein
MKDITGVHIVSGPDGRPSGEAFVELTNDDAARRALTKHRQMMGSRYIEVFRSTKNELYGAITPSPMMTTVVPPQQQQLLMAQNNFYAQQAMAAMPSDYPFGNIHEHTVLKMRGLPYSAGERDIADFFVGYVIAPNGIHILYNAQSRPTGEAMVEFVTPDEAQRAMSRHKATVGNRYVELFRCSKADLLNSIGSNSYSMHFLAGPNSWVARVRGLPWSATPDDIAKFFMGLRIMPNGIFLPLNYNGKPSGEAFVQFMTAEDLDMALSKHRQTLGSRYVEVFRSSTAEMEKSAGRR